MTAARTLVAVALLALTICAAPAALAGSDEDGIRQAVLNYADSVYRVKPELVAESVHPHLQKIGYASRDGVNFRELWMNFYELQQLAASWNDDGEIDAETARRDVEVLDRMGRIAVARLDAEWGVDFFHLAKIDGTWKIMNVIWTTYPPEPEEAAEGEAADR